MGTEYFIDKYSDYEKLFAVVEELVMAKNADPARAVRLGWPVRSGQPDRADRPRK